MELNPNSGASILYSRINNKDDIKELVKLINMQSFTFSKDIDYSKMEKQSFENKNINLDNVKSLGIRVHLKKMYLIAMKPILD